MIRASLILIPVIVISLAGSGDESHVVSDANDHAVAEVRSLELHLCDLITSGHLDEYGRHVTDDYVRIGPNGSLADKTHVLEAMRQNRILSMDPRDIRIRVYGDAAVLTVDLTWKQQRAASVVALHSRITKTFVRRHQQWFLASLTEVPLAP